MRGYKRDYGATMSTFQSSSAYFEQSQVQQTSLTLLILDPDGPNSPDLLSSLKLP